MLKKKRLLVPLFLILLLCSLASNGYAAAWSYSPKCSSILIQLQRIGSRRPFKFDLEKLKINNPPQNDGIKIGETINTYRINIKHAQLKVGNKLEKYLLKQNFLSAKELLSYAIADSLGFVVPDNFLMKTKENEVQLLVKHLDATALIDMDVPFDGIKLRPTAPLIEIVGWFQNVPGISKSGILKLCQDIIDLIHLNYFLGNSDANSGNFLLTRIEKEYRIVGIDYEAVGFRDISKWSEFWGNQEYLAMSDNLRTAFEELDKEKNWANFSAKFSKIWNDLEIVDRVVISDSSFLKKSRVRLREILAGPEKFKKPGIHSEIEDLLPQYESK